MAGRQRRGGPIPVELSTDTWPVPASGAVRLGGEAHKRLFCRMLLDTFDPYRPAVIDWPKLDPESQGRLTSLPIWDMAVQIEGLAMRRVKAYADAVADPLVKAALELNAFEEGRHKEVLSCLVEAYGVQLQPEPLYRTTTDPELSFMITGFGECVDSFFAFGLFEAAKRSGFFPAALVDTFEPVIAEEGRHILFFVNWIAWRRRTIAWWRRPWLELKVLAAWLAVALDHISLARGVEVAPDAELDSNFTLSAANKLGKDVSLADLLDLCLSENERRLGKYDPRLIRPRFVPSLIRLAQKLLRPTAPMSAAA